MSCMNCPKEERLYRFSAGLLEERERLETLHHLSSCSSCRESFESRRGALRDRMHREAVERGHLPPDRSGLRRRVFRAVARDCQIRESVPKRTTPPLHPRVALVAAAVLILAVIGVRYLGETR